MILIVECGATKSDWTLLDRGVVHKSFQTEGLNFSSGDEEFIAHTLEYGVLTSRDAADSACLDAIYFYAAGLFPSDDPSSPYNILYNCLSRNFPDSKIYLENDLLAAARAVCGHDPGIACILGTGSNVSVYDGETIVSRIPSGGFILGDEGSAGALGKRFIEDYIKGMVPECVALAFEEKYDLSYSTIVRNVYHGNSPAAYLGNFAPDILAFYDDNRYMSNLVDENFRRFIERCLLPAIHRSQGPLHLGVVGGFAYACRRIFDRLAGEYDLHVDKYLASPSEELIKFHQK